MVARRWLDNEVSLSSIKDLTVAVVGYGIQGSAQASNMKDSGVSVIVGLRPNGKSWSKAERDGHRVLSVSDAVKQADIIHILVPDMEQGNTYKSEIGPFLSENKAISFSHGASIHWKWIEYPNNIDVIMIAQRVLAKG